MRKVSELKGSKLEVWQKGYPRREVLRAELGQKAVAYYSRVLEMPEQFQGVAERSVDKRLKRRGAKPGSLRRIGMGNILLNEFKWAASANHGLQGENLDVRVGVLDLSQINTPEEIEDWGNTYRIRPLFRESILKDKKRIMLVAYDKDKEPVGHAAVVFGGPVSRKDESQPEEPEFIGLPSEPEVKAIIGENAPWGEDLTTLEGYRGGGVATRLVLEIEQRIKQMDGVNNIFAFAVQPGNKNARHIYDRMGYQPVPVAGQETFVSHIEGPGRLVMLMAKEL